MSDEDSSRGICSWRMTNESPFFEKVNQEDGSETSLRWWKKMLPFRLRPGSSKQSDPIYLMEASMDQKTLCCVHESGKMSLWSLPGLVSVKEIPLEEQGCHDDMNPEMLQRHKRQERAGNNV